MYTWSLWNVRMYLLSSSRYLFLPPRLCESQTTQVLLLPPKPGFFLTLQWKSIFPGFFMCFDRELWIGGQGGYVIFLSSPLQRCLEPQFFGYQIDYGGFRSGNCTR